VPAISAGISLAARLPNDGSHLDGPAAMQDRRRPERVVAQDPRCVIDLHAANARPRRMFHPDDLLARSVAMMT